MKHNISIEEFISDPVSGPLIDVRSPNEYLSGHIPGSVNIPLFNNDERAEIGTLYKKQGREEAILRGLEISGPKMRPIIEQVKESLAGSKKVTLNCWRGGMRSNSVAWLLDMYGFRVSVISGGYKSYRRWALKTLEEKKKVLVLGGKTGSAKTDVLSELRSLGEQVVDLERLASHKGSAFGSIGEPPQPTQEQFENDLALEWSKIYPARPVWLEDESRMIGFKVIPPLIWEQMRESDVIYAEIPREVRIGYLVRTYGTMSKDALSLSIEKIKKRLGGLAYRQAIEALEADDLSECAAILLNYYDKTYLHGLEKRDKSKIHRFAPREFSPVAIAKEAIKISREWR